MSRDVRVNLNECHFVASVIQTEWGWKVRIPYGLQLDASEGDMVRFGFSDERTQAYQWTASYPAPPEVWISLRLVIKPLPPKPVKHYTSGEVRYG